MYNDLSVEKKYKLNVNLKSVFITNNEVVIKHGSRSVFSKILSDHANTNIIGPLVRAFRKPASLKELLDQNTFDNRFYDDIVSIVSTLVKEGVLVDAAEGIAESYLRAIQGATTSLSISHVGLIGCGQAGARIARHLALLGVGKLSLLDDAPVPTDEGIRRLACFAAGSLREEKCTLVENLATNLDAEAQRPIATVSGTTLDELTVGEIFEVCDFVIAAFDEYRLSLLHMVNQQALDADKPWVSLYVDGSEGVIGPVFVPGETCCFNEFFQQGLAAAGMLKKEAMTYIDALETSGTSSIGIAMPPHIDIVCGQLVCAVVDYLITGRSFLVGRAVRHDFERLSVDYEDIHRLPRCPACRPFRPFRHTFL